MIERGHLNIGLILSVIIGILGAVLIIRLISARDAKVIASTASNKAPIGFTGGDKDKDDTDPAWDNSV